MFLYLSLGSIVRIGFTQVSVRDIPAVKTIYSVKETFLKTPWYKDFTLPGDNMFNTANIGYHRMSRHLLGSSMADSAITKLTPQINRHIEYTIEKMKTENESLKAIDVYKWWLFMTTDIIVELTYRESFHMLGHGKVSQDRPVAATEDC